ncbi:MAG: hydrogenase iron-sulfur subunit [Desulfobacteraceae bacterium]|nr:MAG: hydrogenase iron-sulfur subunit [Desulfobacteraceae bacterium]
MTTEFKHLEKWEGTLASCIRCGYCFEHCPLMKHTGWESDAPRAKIITAFGLLSGNVQPTDYVAHRMFSCFYCKRCEAACSSGVDLTDIFDDAQRDLLGMGFPGPGTASVTFDNCARCLVCIKACPHEARSYDGDAIATDPVKCKSCGACVEACPAGAAQIIHNYGTGKTDLTEKVTQFLEEGPSAKAVVYACNWSFYPDLQASELPDEDEQERDYKILVNMCGGRLEMPVLMAPFLHGARGVMVACCPDDECEHQGNLRAKKLVESLKSYMEKMDMDTKRVELVQIKAGDKQDFQMHIDTFVDTLNQLGPLR